MRRIGLTVLLVLVGAVQAQTSTPYATRVRKWVSPDPTTCSVSQVGFNVTTGIFKGCAVANTWGAFYIVGGADVAVADGGTGASSFTAYSPIFAGTTSTGAFQSISIGTSGQVLTSNGAGVLPSYQTVSAGANTALSNLASVAVNTSLLPGVDNSIDLGSSAKRWRNGYVGTTLNLSQGASIATVATGTSDAILQMTRSSGPAWADSDAGNVWGILSLSLLATTDKTFTLPNVSGTFVLGSLGATDNAVLRADGAGGSTAQGSGMIVGDVSGASLPISGGVGNAIALSATAPTATTGASQAGKAISVTASDAVASTDTAGAAAGGGWTVTTGAAARNTSGDADGGNGQFTFGAGIGTGVRGQLRVGAATTADTTADVLVGLSATTRRVNIQQQPSPSTEALALTKSDLSLLLAAGLATANNAPADGGGVRVGVGNGATNGGGYVSGSAAFFGSTTFGAGVSYSTTVHGAFSSDGLQLASTGGYCWNDGTIADQGYDLCVARDAAGTARIAGNLAGTTKGASKIVADSNGSSRKDDSTGELLTLSLAATGTPTVGNLAAADSDIEAILARVTTTILTSTDWSVAVTSGIASCTNAWVAIGTTTTAQTGLTAGTTVKFKPAAGLQCHVGTASTLTVTVTGIATAGAIRLTPIIKTYTAPTS